jgi:Lrp/AsnC family transcriptional regulator, leucine-responsive regulatory protein
MALRYFYSTNAQFMQTLDDYDRNLLRLLQQNNQLTAQQLGEQVNLSSSAVQRRVQKLRADKIIEADISIVSPAAANIGLTCIVDVCLHEDGARAVDNFMKEFDNSPEVSQCYYVTGTFDLVLVINTENMGQYEAFSSKHFMNNPNVKNFYTHVVMKRLKINYAVSV